MRPIKLILGKSAGQLALLAFLCFLIINMANWIGELVANSNTEYSLTYKEKSDKGFLTEDEVLQLKKLETKHLSNLQSRNARMRGYFGALAFSMVCMFVLFFWLKYKNVVQLKVLTLAPIVLFTAILATGSVGQSLAWLIFALCGMLLADFARKKIN
jgi:uncharacterized membrane protein (DUF106 family)